ncbi:MAG: prolipoprotein diacylglyceryl transferase [Flavobacteriaceae bacterium]|nr:prolipoprotein diacylglyceryl transferase [Flavobacteriaceae bacterium]
MVLLKFNWAPDEVFIKIGSLGIHYYSLMFIIAFAIGYYIMKKMYKNEGVSDHFLEPLFIYTVLGTLIGARLGEVFFYNWDYFQDHLVEILLPVKEVTDGSMLFGLIQGWEFTGYRGLASHGAAIGIITAMILYRKKYPYKTVIWILDRIVIPVSFGAIFIRIGNFFNSEIVGKYTGSNFGVVFENRGEILPRHPAQLYESLGYVFVFLILRHMYWNTQRKDQSGFLFGAFLALMFSVRFVVEFVKESQGGFESALGLLSTGQWLSIPLILTGLIFAYRAQKNT